ncbi:MAG: radical SAM protein [Desulfobacterales bacterium]
MTRRRRQDEYADESGAIRKSWRNRLRVALGYPNRYAVGMSSLGFQAVYGLLNAREEVVCERFFLPAPGSPVRTVESGRPISDFDIVAFSVSFENDYVHLVRLLKEAGLPLPAEERGSPHPLVMAGGVACFLNPEPIAPFLDCVLIGEAEAVLPGFLDRYDPREDRRTLLRALAREVEGVYVPSFYRIAYASDGTLASITPDGGVPERVRRARVGSLDEVSTRTVVLTEQTSFSGTALIEVSRGCPHGCRFCSAGFVYRPPRFRPVERLEAEIRDELTRTDRIGLVGAAISDLPGVGGLCARLEGDGVRISFSSLRADALTPELIHALRQNRTKTATIAPEAGSERMRRVINKGVTEEDVMNAAVHLVEGGIPNLKLYFIVGLPTETDDDVDAVVDLVARVRAGFLEASRPRKRIGTLTVSVTPFIPKPFTPFQWAPMEPEAQLRRKLAGLRQRLARMPNVRFQSEAVRESVVQALLSRGDRRLAESIALQASSGESWSRYLKRSALGSALITQRRREPAEILPWDLIDIGVSKAFLWKEYQRALTAKTTAPCPMHACRICGVCG